MGILNFISIGIFSLLLNFNMSLTRAQVSWTPIYVDTSNRLDLWTVRERGCECPDDKKSRDCACCVKPGGCLCSFNHNKCAQCGLEDSCQRFCNTTISSRLVASKSSFSWVQIKSPVLEGPTSCWWRVESAPGQRIELQIHRLVSVGSYDNSTQKCSKGFVQFSDGDVSVPSSQSIQLCAENSRFSPPVVFFGDHPIATLLLRIDGKTSRSQLLAYVSFSSADDPSVGDPAKGGKPSPNTICEWSYDNCWDQECVLTSPGYPGLYPPHRRCRYYLVSNSTTDKIQIHFQTVHFPLPPLCSTAHVSVWRRNSSTLTNNGPPLKTLCQEIDYRIEIEGGGGIVEFRSSFLSPPYIYNGFRATVKFIKSSHPPPSHNIINNIKHIGREETTTTTQKTDSFYSLGIEEKENGQELEGMTPITCGHIFDGSVTRGEMFRLIIPKDLTLRPLGNILRSFGTYATPQKQPPPGPFKCQIEFRGKSTDIVQFGVFAYKFRGSNCSTVVELYDIEGVRRSSNSTDRLLSKLCGPSGHEVKRFTSSHSQMALITLVTPHEEQIGTEFLEGAFRFHDESVEGTVKPPSACEVVYYGVTSVSSGIVSGPPNSPLLRLSTYPLLCAHSFIPTHYQSIGLSLTVGGEQRENGVGQHNNYCTTHCSSSGCRCETKYSPLHSIDHLLLLAGSTPIACLCGYFMDILPMVFESHAPLTLVYHATQSGSEFRYSVGFQFKNKTTCANFTIEPPSSSKRWKEILGGSVVGMRTPHYYTYFQCSWPISIPPRYKLTLDFISEEDEEDCKTWNLTVWANNYHSSSDSTLSLFSFCPQQGRSEIQIPDTVQSAYIKLSGVTLRPPQFEVRWKYFDVMLGSGLLAEKKINRDISFSIRISDNPIVPLLALFCLPIFIRLI